MNLQEVPSLRPTSEQFEDPIGYLSSAENMALGAKYGVVKIIPPRGFNPPFSINENKFRFIPRLQKLKELSLINRCRIMFTKQLRNYNEMRKINKPKDTFELVGKVKIYYYDFYIETVKYYQPNQQEIPDISSSILMKDQHFWSHLHKTFQVSEGEDSLKNFYYDKLISYFNYLSTKPNFSSIKEKYPSSLLQQDDSDNSDSEEEETKLGEDYHCLICHKDEYPKDTLLCDSCDKPYHRYCLSPPLSKIPKDNWYCDNCIIGNGYYGFTDSSYKYSLGDFKDMCQDFDKDFFKTSSAGNKPVDVGELERIFWDLVNDTNNEVKVNYGADIKNNKEGEVSGFPTIGYKPRDQSKVEFKKYVEHPMNLNNLPFNEKSLLNFLYVDISGMTIPWIYVGSTFSTFCWHVEDQYTLSANYQHLGAVKKWYCVPESNCLKFEQYMKSLAPDLFLKQPDILHQLITLVPPSQLVANGIEVFTANQHPGEYVVTYPRVYHAGFNCGFNFNEAVNFTMNEWVGHGVQATKDYKNGSQKASVFDIYEMMVNILKEYVGSDPEGPPTIERSLAQKCIKHLSAHLENDSQLKQTILDTKLITKPVEIYQKPSKFDFHHKARTEKFDDDGISCMKCKGFCTFSYVKHFKLPPAAIKKNNYLPTPHASPHENSNNSCSSNEAGRHSKRLKTLNENNNYEVQVLCLEDYVKVRATSDNIKTDDDCSLIDELFTVVDFDSVKNLLNEAKNKLIEQTSSKE